MYLSTSEINKDKEYRCTWEQAESIKIESIGVLEYMQAESIKTESKGVLEYKQNQSR